MEIMKVQSSSFFVTKERFVSFQSLSIRYFCYNVTNNNNNNKSWSTRAITRATRVTRVLKNTLSTFFPKLQPNPKQKQENSLYTERYTETIPTIQYNPNQKEVEEEEFQHLKNLQKEENNNNDVCYSKKQQQQQIGFHSKLRLQQRNYSNMFWNYSKQQSQQQPDQLELSKQQVHLHHDTEIVPPYIHETTESLSTTTTTTTTTTTKISSTIYRSRRRSYYVLKREKYNIASSLSTRRFTKEKLRETKPKQNPNKSISSNYIPWFIPSWIEPYTRLARFDKPIGTMLLLWPCFWSTALAAQGGDNNIDCLPDVTVLTLFGIGAFSMRSAGCIINDMWDQDIDRQVSRTQSTRPLATGELTNTQALPFLAINLLTGLAVLLSLPNNEDCFYWGVPSLALVVAYPTMKRFFPYPQAFLGITMNWGCFMGYVAVQGSTNTFLDASIVLPLYGSGVLWTIVYDTIYAHQDKIDDKRLGLQSTALSFGDSYVQQKRILHTFAALTYVQWLLTGYNYNTIHITGTIDAPLYVAGMSIAYAHLTWQIHTADFDNGQNCMERFKSNTTVGGIVFASIVTSKYFSVLSPLTSLV